MHFCCKVLRDTKWRLALPRRLRLRATNFGYSGLTNFTSVDVNTSRCKGRRSQPPAAVNESSLLRHLALVDKAALLR